jgi:hypothetical protein
LALWEQVRIRTGFLTFVGQLLASTMAIASTLQKHIYCPDLALAGVLAYNPK